MAGSYRHVTNSDGTFRGFDLVENGGDAAETIDEMWKMIDWLARRLNERAGSNPDHRVQIYEAWLEGYLRPLGNGNADNPRLASFERFWSDD